MNNNLSNVEISVQELKLLVNTLTKSVALSLRKRYTWLGVVAGLLIGSCLTLAIIYVTANNTDKITEITQTLLEQSRESLSELKQINSKISQLAQATQGVNKKTTDNKMSASTDVAEKKTSAPQDEVQPEIYTVYVHYTNKKNEKLMERLSVFLNQNGYRVQGIQKVNYHHRDIRYFHDEDKQGAVLLQKHLTGFINTVTDTKITNIKIINLSSKFPNAQKKALELWVNF